MQSGDYGSIEYSILEKYRLECNQLWPQANIFQINPISTFDQSHHHHHIHLFQAHHLHIHLVIVKQMVVMVMSSITQSELINVRFVF